jgi:hypothetical protein
MEIICNPKFPLHFFEIDFNITLPPTPESFSWTIESARFFENEGYFRAHENKYKEDDYELVLKTVVFHPTYFRPLILLMPMISPPYHSGGV